MKTQTIYIEVPVSERLPDNTDRAYEFAIMDRTWYGVKGSDKTVVCHCPDKKGKEFEFRSDIGAPVTHWLEKKEDQIVFTEQELKERDRKIAGDAFDEGWNASWASEKYTEDKEKYLTKLIK